MSIKRVPPPLYSSAIALATADSIAAFALSMFPAGAGPCGFTSCTLIRSVPAFSYTLCSDQ